jgi:hypothetical protein
VSANATIHPMNGHPLNLFGCLGIKLNRLVFVSYAKA